MHAPVSASAAELPAHLQIGRVTRAVYLVACVASFSLLAVFVVKIAGSQALTWHSVFAVPAGMALADFLSGMIHWGADTWGRESMPVLGKRLLHPFRVHHVNPADFLKRRFIDTNGDVALLMIPVLAAACSTPIESAGAASWAVFVASLSGVGLMTNQVHQWAHMRRAPAPVRWLQRAGVILSYRAHCVHHRRPHTRNYCIATGWCNAPLEALRFYPVLERLLTKCTGAQPRADERAFAQGVGADER